MFIALGYFYERENGNVGKRFDSPPSSVFNVIC